MSLTPRSRRLATSAIALALFAFSALPACALPPEQGLWHWLAGPLARLASLFADAGGYIDPNGKDAPPPSPLATSGTTGLFADAGSQVDPNGKDAPPPTPLAAGHSDQN